MSANGPQILTLVDEKRWNFFGVLSQISWSTSSDGFCSVVTGMDLLSSPDLSCLTSSSAHYNNFIRFLLTWLSFFISFFHSFFLLFSFSLPIWSDSLLSIQLKPCKSTLKRLLIILILTSVLSIKILSPFNWICFPMDYMKPGCMIGPSSYPSYFEMILVRTYGL